MANRNFWFILVIFLVLYALVPGVQNFINGLIMLSEVESEPLEKQEAKASKDISEGTFLVFFALSVTGIILSFYAGYLYHKRKVLRNGRFEESDSKNKEPKKRGKLSAFKDKILSNPFAKASKRNRQI